jgi:cell division protein FtsA
MAKPSYIVGLDLGSTKTCALICQLNEEGKLEVAGVGTAESKGWRRGVIVSLDSVVLSIKKAVEAAEDVAGVPADSAYVGIGGPQIKGVDSRGAVTLGPKGREVQREDVQKVFQAAQAISLPPDRKLIYAERQEYLLDSQNGIRNPVGMTGKRLEANVHLITGSLTAHENIVTAANRAGIVVLETVFEGMASAEACVTPDEKELGVAVVDIGGGSSELVIYAEGSVRRTASIPVGGEHFTNDIAVGLRTPIPEAEKMKLAWGECDPADPSAPVFEVASVGERPARIVNYTMLKEIIEPRAAELLELLQAELGRFGYENQIPAGIVLTGGGAKLGGLAALAERTLHQPVRIGRPQGLEAMGDQLSDPAFATAVGLVLRGNRLRRLRESQDGGWKGWLKGFFG